MRTITKARPSPARTGHGGPTPLIHVFWLPRHRWTDGGVTIVPGDKALCGYVKRTQSPGMTQVPARDRCVVCQDLDR